MVHEPLNNKNNERKKLRTILDSNINIEYAWSILYLQVCLAVAGETAYDQTKFSNW